jgi:uncharacterized protein (TIGR02217 family)
VSLPYYPSIDPAGLGVRGLTWPIKRHPEWRTQIHEATSGKEFRLAYWTYPRWHYEISYNYLKDNPDDLYEQNTDTDLRTLEGFFLQMQGSLNPFLFFDPSDNTVQGQIIGTGNATQTQFQMVRTFGGFIEPIQAPFGNPAINVYLNGTLQAATSYSIGSTGIITFNTAPGSGVVITADFSYNFTCRFEKDMLELENFMFQLWSLKQVEIISVKL